MTELEGEDHKVTEPEREFWRSLCVVVQHLSDRALKAEAEVRRLRKELSVREDYRVGKYHADYSEVTAAQLQEPQPELDKLFKDSKVISVKREP